MLDDYSAEGQGSVVINYPGPSPIGWRLSHHGSYLNLSPQLHTEICRKPFLKAKFIWLVVLTILKNISQWEGLSHILWKIKNVPNHQPVMVADPDLNFSRSKETSPFQTLQFTRVTQFFNIGFCFQHISRPPVLFSEQILREPGCRLHLFHPQQLKPQRCRCCCAQCRLSKLRHYNYNLNICTYIYIQCISIYIYVNGRIICYFT